MQCSVFYWKAVAGDEYAGPFERVRPLLLLIGVLSNRGSSHVARDFMFWACSAPAPPMWRGCRLAEIGPPSARRRLGLNQQRRW